MNVLLPVALAVGAGAAGALLGNRNLSRARPLAGRALLVAAGLLAGVALLLLLPYAERSPAELVATGFAVALLAGGLLSDLREREVDVLPLFAGAAIAALIPLLVDGSIAALVGALTGLLLSTGLYATGRLYARVRDLGPDPETGERLDPLGAGDIALLTLLGAYAAPISGPLGVVSLLVAGLLLHVVGTVARYLARRLARRPVSLGDPVELAPFLVAGALLVVLYG